jgi:imidazolonepropionase-like amidohydrolase
VAEEPTVSIVFECDKLFDGYRTIEDAVVIVDGDRISAVHRKKDFPEGRSLPGERVSCQFLMPGLIDSHVHVSGYLEGSPAGNPFGPVKNFMRLLIYNGVTTVRDTGNSIETIKYLREWGQKYAGPRVFGSGPLLDIPPLVWSFSRIVRSPDAARREVELLHLEGMDFIKAYRNITPEILESIVKAASACGMDVAVDNKCTSAQQACRIGVKSIEHMANLLDESWTPQASDADAYKTPVERIRLWSRLGVESDVVSMLVDLLAKHGTCVCPTLLVLHRLCSLAEMVNEPYLDYMIAVMPYHKYFKRMRSWVGMAIGQRFARRYMALPKLTRAQRAEVENGLRNMVAMTNRLHKAGVCLVAGSDSPNPSIVPGFSLHQEMAIMVQSGMSPEAVLSSATSAPAKMLHQERLGKIEAGACADILVLDGDPTTRISDTMQIKAVIKAGRIVDREKALGLVTRAISKGNNG